MRHMFGCIRGSSAVLLVVGATTSAVSAQDSATELADLRERVEQLEAQQGGTGFNLPGDTTVEIYGYAKVDLFFDLDSPLGTTFFGLANLEPGFTKNSDSSAQAFQSRLGFRTSTETDLGTLKTVIEGDFFGNGGGSFRLRHAYGSLGGFLAGQTWTNFMPIESYPGTLDFQGPAGIPFVREAQVRYTHDVGNGFMLSGSVEDDPSGVSTRLAVTAAASYEFGDSFVKLAVLSRQVEGATEDVDGWGVNLSGYTSLWEGNTIQASLTTGEAIGSYMVFGGADVFGNTAVETDGLTLGISQDFAEKFSAGLVYGLRDIKQGAATDTETLETLHLTLNYKPVERVNVGLEYITGERTLFNNRSARADRVQTSVQFNF